jgi:hypothetical protein
MGMLDDPDNLMMQAIVRLFVLAMGWGFAWLVGWLFSSNLAFSAIGILWTAGSINGARLWYRRRMKTQFVRQEPYL